MNQPAGYNAGRNVSPPRYVYGRRHEYIYYPVAWIDAGTGTRYEKGYYDESGNRYEDVAFQKNGNYENVLCHCPYCEQDTLINLSVKDVESRSLQCPNCGGAMEIRSALDDAVQNTAGTADRETYTDQPVQPRKRGRGCLFSVVIVLIVMFVMSVIGERLTDSPSQEPVQIVSGQDGSADYNRRSTLYLVRTGDNSYRVTDSGDSADKTMKWDSYQESFYDPETECWIWYNTELEEPVWQYWVEGISSDYGDYGWMEHDWDGWWIEAGYGDWIELPAKYDASRLWYID